MVPVWGCTGSDDSNELGPQPSTMVIGPDGGEISSLDHNLRIVIPPGALDAAVEISITLMNSHPPSIGQAYEIAPAMPLSLPASITYFWGTTNIGTYDMNALAVGVPNDNRYVALDMQTLDVEEKSVTAPDPALSYSYGLIEGEGVGTTSDTSGSDT
ncbi:MAG TPA: hypothetical protein VG755_32060, partial [Nannocystaceae bacterium]|nr:hypothetical protein [Nannocystaceae bacterium]